MSKKNRKQIEFLGSDSQTAGPPKTPEKALTGAPHRTEDDPWLWVEDLLPLGIGLLAIVMARAVEPGIRDLFQLPKQLFLATGAVLLVGMAGALAAIGRPLRFRTSPMVWAGLAFMCSILLSLVIAPRHTGGVLSLFAEYDAHRWLSAAAIFWVTLVGVRRPRHIWYLLGGMVIGGLVVALIGIGEQHNILSLLPEKRWVVISKPGSTFGNRNMAAEVVVAVIPFAYVGLAAGVRAFANGRQMLGIGLLATMSISLDLLLYYLMLTVTRSAWAGAIAGFAVAAVVWFVGNRLAHRDAKAGAAGTGERAGAGEVDPLARPRGLFGQAPRKVLVPIAMLVALNGGIAGIADRYKPVVERVDEGDQKRNKSVPELLKSFFDFESSAYRWRFSMLAASWNAMKHEPLGGGAGNWRVMFPKYLVQREKNEMFTIAKQPIRAHNDFLMVGVEYGWQGLLSLLALLASATWLTVRAVRNASRPRQDAEGAATLAFAAVGSLMGIVGICGDAMASFPLQLPMPTFIFCVLLGVIAAADGLLAPEAGQEPPVAAQRWPSWAATGTIGAAVLAMMFLQGFGNYVGLHDRLMIAEHGFTDARNKQKQSRRAAEGLVDIRRALAINPNDFQNHFIEALCLNSMGKTKEAIDSLHRSVALYPNLLNAWVNIAMFSARIGDTVRMNEAIDKALELKPDELIALNVRLNRLSSSEEWPKILELVARQYPGYQAYLDSGNWPVDDHGQLLGAYKTTLNHGVTAAHKLTKWAEAARYQEALEALGIPNDGRSDEDKRKERRERASDIADSYRHLGQYDKALPWAKSAAELAGREYPELKRAYAVTLAYNSQFAAAEHEAWVAVSLDRSEKSKLVKDLQEVRGKSEASELTELITKVSSWFEPVAAPAPPLAPTDAVEKP